MQLPMTEVIAVRRFWWDGEPERPLFVSIGKPVQAADGKGEFYCPIQTVGFGNDSYVQPIFGVDAFQAMELAIRFVGWRMFDINAKNGGRLRWQIDEESTAIPHEWELTPVRIELTQQTCCEKGHEFVVEAGLVQNRYTQEVYIHCPECSIPVGSLGSEYPREWLPSQLKQWSLE
jgi:hypothetical protein